MEPNIFQFWIPFSEISKKHPTCWSYFLINMHEYFNVISRANTHWEVYTLQTAGEAFLPHFPSDSPGATARLEATHTLAHLIILTILPGMIIIMLIVGKNLRL